MTTLDIVSYTFGKAVYELQLFTCILNEFKKDLKWPMKIKVLGKKLCGTYGKLLILYYLISHI